MSICLCYSRYKKGTVKMAKFNVGTQKVQDNKTKTLKVQ